MSLFKKDRILIVEKKDVTTVLSVINRRRIESDYNIGKCGWANAPSKWFVKFYASNREWESIANDLLKNGTITLHTRTSGTIDLYFERA